MLRLLERRSARMATWSPRLWRPADDVAAVLRATVERQLAATDAVALGTDDAVLLGVRRGAGAAARVVVDHLDSATDDPDELARLLAAVPTETGTVSVFTPVADDVRRRATEVAGLVVTGRWWVRDLPQTLAVAGGRLADPLPGYSLAPSPPLHDPGGPVAVVGRVGSDRDLVRLGVDAAARGARVAVVVGPAADVELAAAAEAAAYQPLAEVRERLGG